MRSTSSFRSPELFPVGPRWIPLILTSHNAIDTLLTMNVIVYCYVAQKSIAVVTVLHALLASILGPLQSS